MRTRPAHAFSLIEVLIAVLILALGLLGLGALFPVVIREQRIGTEMTMGILAADAARAELDALQLPDVNGEDFWAAWRQGAAPIIPNTQPSAGGVQARIPIPGDYTPVGPSGGWYVPPIDPQSGDLKLGLDDGNPPPHVFAPHIVKVYDRLYPRDIKDIQPQFVWDMAVQRVIDSDGANSNDALRFVIFVRRIDPRIRVPVANLPGAVGLRKITLLDTLTNRNLPNADWRVPVAADSTTTYPTQDGLGSPAGPNYAVPRIVEVFFYYESAGSPDDRRRDRLYARSNQVGVSHDWELAKQVNQRLIDNLGNQYTVIEAGVDANRGQFVRISPEVPAFVTTQMAQPFAAVNADAIRQVVFTPQVPAGVVIWTVKP